MYIYLYTVCEGIQSRIRTPLFKNCEQSEPGKIYENLIVASEASRKIWEKLATPPPPNCRKVKVRLFIFFTEKDRLFIFSIFKIRILIFTKCQPPPPLRIKWSSPPPMAYTKCKYATWEKSEEQEPRAMLSAGQCLQGCGRIQCDIQESTATSHACK